ncbi:adenosylcobinamide-phosphate synthase CbiB [Sphingobium yanoikuyae]|uniref:Cobalamin biosynthesis protein CobD n=1 Tax=Sphingobium yanoikuyae TaxID=13690 RepID=A0A3G2UZW8_SPHYA|nr:adenosylcobinamide-phosphate synthase CbiB [Sphingobium yanoikuyae]AYO79592.1 cobalamin biosynthesis protein CobD [Sphingobium yanoikuyae]
MADPVALLALALDAAVGWPAALYRRIGHPVGGFARLIDHCAARWNDPARSALARQMGGIATLLLLLSVAGGGGWLVQYLLRLWLPLPWSWMLIGLLAYPALALRSLYSHVRAVHRALAADDLTAAREAVGMIVGRDTQSLDESGVTRAAIESLAESFCDGVVAPFFWLLLLGLPGVWAYKAVNTADSMIGHREAPWGPFGWAAARTDDLMNLIPARLAGCLLCLAGGGGWRVMWRDARNHASPNAGWPEAAMAGALDLRLAGPIRYDGVRHDKPWIGSGRIEADPLDLRWALAIYVQACLLLWLVAGLQALFAGDMI